MTPTTTLTPEPAHPEVSAGVAWLDQHRPGWATGVNLKTLDLRNPYRCVVAQITGLEYQHGLVKLDIGVFGMWPRKLGFGVPERLGFAFRDRPADVLDWWRSADRLWRAAVAERAAGEIAGEVGNG